MVPPLLRGFFRIIFDDRKLTINGLPEATVSTFGPHPSQFLGGCPPSCRRRGEARGGLEFEEEEEEVGDGWRGSAEPPLCYWIGG